MNIKRYFNNGVCAQVSQQHNTRKIITVAIELIPRESDNNDYENKILVQLKESEVSVLLETLLLYREEMSIGNHGSNNDKMLTVRNQNNGLFIFMREGRKETQLTFVIDEDARFELLTLVADVVAKRDKISVKDVLDLLRALSSRRAQLNINR
ncbi:MULTISPECIES: hypothetical protein [Vibrio]|uniref:Uncharacterized protein n=1 Tax=Vibrio tasmaniensis TaxID=212663 RepID=A0A2N7NCY4_9VIBR|nr:hypothetical protein [Vibrio tasmaniensis]PMO89822.1 hypothetical protein BCT01_00640 [Vibrio tasmaniensis]PMP10005.1 hypothetical protein BCS92_02450 [Vibrio tasmaniensis]TKG32610.1 hypothetical protein FC057_12400 [Vibrio tasmaniensis]TKG41706.1 hypothetical protein FC063_07540 [Vibrio tasmaniensis]TKG52061.1 hypothetical protein FC070_09810 [Vibrio tasmaniensis]